MKKWIVGYLQRKFAPEIARLKAELAEANALIVKLKADVSGWKNRK